MRWIEILGLTIIDQMTAAGRYVGFVKESLQQTFSPPFRRSLLFQQLEFLGNHSLSIIILTGFFVGAVFGLQIGGIFEIFRAESLLGGATAKALTMELSPLLVGFLLAGRAGSAMTAEIATMKVNEQVDAMEAMGVDPISYLVVPRIIASLLVIPLLVVIFSFVGTLGAFITGVMIFDVDQGVFIERINWLVDGEDLRKGIEKALVFSFLIATIACRAGLTATGGAKGVGTATTNAVVFTLLTILGFDFVITYVQFYW
jgi:phospholipid/cholesterol/gamma-HCH transport system permease protein